MFLKGGWDTATFVTNYLPVVLFFILYGAARMYYRIPPVKAKDMDFVSGIAEGHWVLVRVVIADVWNASDLREPRFRGIPIPSSVP